MSIIVNTGFHIGSATPIDDRLVLTKEQMLNIDENLYPDVYMCVCKDDGMLYTFQKDNELNGETGKFRVATGDSFNTWTGTKSEYEAVSDTLEIGTIVTITDDNVDIIDDVNVSTDTTYSSSKIDSIVGDIETALDTIIGGA